MEWACDRIKAKGPPSEIYSNLPCPINHGKMELTAFVHCNNDIMATTVTIYNIYSISIYNISMTPIRYATIPVGFDIKSRAITRLRDM